MYAVVPSSGRLREIWNRITSSRLTIIYLCFTLIHFSSQLAIQSIVFDHNMNGLNELTHLVANKSALNKGLPILQGSVLKLCTWVPEDLDTDDCTVIWSGSSMVSFTANATKHATTTTKAFDSVPHAADTKYSVVSRAPKNSVSPSCQVGLVWPIYVLKEKDREDLTFLAFQFWVLGMSLVALLNESIPHIFASMLTHMMSAGWAVYQIIDTARFRSDFHRIIVQDMCKGIQTLPNVYWSSRGEAELVGLVLNVVAVFISGYLTWRLTKLFGWKTFKRIGASLVINRLYRLVLLLSIAIQLCLFFVAVAVSLWIDQLINSPIGDQAQFRALYLVSSGATLALLLPWLVMGWIGARRELKTPMLLFLFLALLYIGCWSAMFVSTTFRWTFVTWGFFSVIASASFFLTCASLILGIICLCNFGKGLVRYLYVAEHADATKPYDTEDKFGYWSNEWTIPTDFDQPQSSITRKPAPGYDDPEPQITKGDVITTLPLRYDSLRHPPRAYDHKRNRSDAPLLSSQGGVQRSLSDASTSSSFSSHPNDTEGTNGSKRWIIE